MAKAIAAKSALLARFPRAYPILDTGHLAASATTAVAMAETLASSGFPMVQYRHKGSYTRTVFEEAAAVGAVFRAAGVCYIINDRADIALALQADGVHVGQEDLPLDAVRRIVGEQLLVGYSTHNATQLSSAVCRHADYLAVGPVFDTSSKSNPDPVVGLDGVRQARALTVKPLVAIGGIRIENAGQVLRAGADCVAMISGFSGENVSEWARTGPAD